MGNRSRLFVWLHDIFQTHSCITQQLAPGRCISLFQNNSLKSRSILLTLDVLSCSRRQTPIFYPNKYTNFCRKLGGFLIFSPKIFSPKKKKVQIRLGCNKTHKCV